MTLALYSHPLASFCHKVLIALYENGTAFEEHVVDLGDPTSAAEVTSRWPVGKIPVLHDRARDRIVPETSIIIEYLDRQYPGAVRLVPEDPQLALEVRLWDRFFDLYVQTPMQKVVIDRLRPEAQRDPLGVAEAREALARSYAMLERQLERRTWVAADHFSMADCAAAPALFYASIVAPFGPGLPATAAYFERLLERPSFARVLRDARPYFHMFPFVSEMPARFLTP